MSSEKISAIQNQFQIHLEKERYKLSEKLKRNGIIFKFVSVEDYKLEVGKNYAKVFDSAKVRHEYSIDEKSRSEAIRSQYSMLHHDYIIAEDLSGNYIGHFSGETEDFSTFYLRNAGLIKEYRNQKISSDFMKQYLDYLFQLGYSRVTSQHHGNNTIVLIMMLKLGFHISGFEAREEWGFLVKCTKLLLQERELLFDSLVKGSGI